MTQTVKPAATATDNQTRILELFHQTAARVPAYQSFLDKAGVDPASVTNFDDFVALVPLMDKQSYLREYSLSELCLDGDLLHNRIISVSSGSSGVPFYWPRGAAQDNDGVAMHTKIYTDIFEMDTTPTLLVICFSMGTWIAGSFTTASSLGYADLGHPLSIVTPGLEKQEAINAVKNLAGHYEQVVIAGYPPFVKDIIEEGKRAGVDWTVVKTRLLMAGEAFSEEWRDHMLGLIHSDDPYHDTVNIFGSADAGMLGHETPLSIIVRRIYNQRPDLLKEVFGVDILPSIVQYDPSRRYFEAVDGEIVFSTAAGIPLIRYNIKDTGGVVPFDDMIDPIRELVTEEAERAGITLETWDMPFVYLNGRKDFSVTIYAVNIYPENIKAGLLDVAVRDLVTGKFTMATKNRSDMEQYFEINVELNPDVHPIGELHDAIRTALIDHLCELNTEFRKLRAVIQDRALPEVNLLSFGDPDHFATGVKHRWVKKEA